MRPWLALLLLAACTSEATDDTTALESSALTTSVIARGSDWRYWDEGGDLGTSWRGVFDDAAWATGAGPLGYGESYVETTVGFGPSSSSKYITTYFRRTFTIDDPADVTGIAAEVMYDDGFVVYLNGVEIQRAAMPTSTVTATTLALGHEIGNAYERFDWTAHAGRLVAGTNVIAVEVHQAAATSSDLTFDLALAVETADAPPVPLGGVTRSDFWRYWDDAAAPDPAWKTQIAAPDGWQFGAGPLGYGETYLATTLSYGSDPANKPITAYFTIVFDVDNPGAVTRMSAEVMYDDGFVAYLNGVELTRRAMPAGTPGATTLSTGHEAGNRYETIDVTARRDLLDAGLNILAVEVHQASKSSSDLVFDMALRLTGEEPPPPSDEEDIARGSVWRFWDRDEAPSADGDWRFFGFNDATWKSGPGPLGYGESYIVTPVDYGPDPADKPITAYFRRTFTVDEPTVQTTMIAELMYDDGVVVYLNGHPIELLHMPTSGPIGHDTRSTGHETGNNYEVYDWSRFAGLLVDGPNQIAVEVHQASPSSSDLTFDLSLTVDVPDTCAIPGGGPAARPAPTSPLRDVWVGATTVFVAGSSGLIGRRDAGGAWCWAEVHPEVNWTAVWGAADDDVWFVGGEGVVVHYDGATFTTVDIGTGHVPNDVTGTGPDDVWIVGTGGMVRHFDGSVWTARDVAATDNVLTVFAVSSDEVWVGGTRPAIFPDDPERNGSSALIYRWDPLEATWVLELFATMEHGAGSVSALHGVSATDIWAVGTMHPSGAACGTHHLWRYDGTAWADVGAPIELCIDLADVAAGSPGAEDGAWFVGSGEGGGPHGARYAGGTWTELSDEIFEDLRAIDHLGSRMWAAGHGFDDGWRQKIIRWDGSRWVQEW